jgi:hypothetical protein
MIGRRYRKWDTKINGSIYQMKGETVFAATSREVSSEENGWRKERNVMSKLKMRILGG